MTLDETRTFLTQLWCAFPSAPRLTEQDRIATVAVWFNILKDFSLRDVWFAADKVIKKNCRFIPSAYEIRCECRASPDVEAFITDEYRELEKSRNGYTHYYSENQYIENSYLQCELEHCTDSMRISEIKAALANNRSEEEKERRMRLLLIEAEKEAVASYHKYEISRYLDDARQLGFTSSMEALA